MKRSIFALVLSTVSIISAQGQGTNPSKTLAPITPTPVGEWLVEDGSAHIRVVSCDAVLWGVLSWAKTAGLDENNPDKSKRGRSIIGVPILLGMQANGANNWKGEVYDADSGRIYSSFIKLSSADVLRIEGCVMGGLICGGEDWKRVPAVAGKATMPPEKEVCLNVQK